MSKRISGKREPVEYQLSMYCTIINKTVALRVQQKIDGHPIVTEWKKIVSCTGNCECNPSDPSTFPKNCPALNLQISKQI